MLPHRVVMMKGGKNMNYDAEVEKVWNSMPLYIGYKEIESLGFKRTRIYD